MRRPRCNARVMAWTLNFMNRSDLGIAARLLLGASLLVLPELLVAQRSAPSTTRPTLRVGRATGELRLDGRLDEASWSAADSIESLTELEPNEGVTPSGRTVVRVLADGDGLVFGIRADDPRRRAHHELRTRARRRSLERGPHQDRARHVSRRSFGIRLRGQSQRRAIRRAGHQPGRGRERELGRGVGGRDGAHRHRLDGGNQDSGAKPPLPPRPRGVGLQRAATRPAPARIEPMGQPRSRREVRPHESRGLLGRGSRVRSRGRLERASGTDRGRWRPRPGRTMGWLARRQPRRQPAGGRQRARVAHGEHRLRRDRGRHTAHQPDALPARLSRKAHLLPRRIGHLRLRAGDRRRRAPVLQPTHRLVRWHSRPDRRGAQGQWARAGDELRCAGRAYG